MKNRNHFSASNRHSRQDNSDKKEVEFVANSLMWLSKCTIGLIVVLFVFYATLVGLQTHLYPISPSQDTFWGNLYFHMMAFAPYLLILLLILLVSTSFCINRAILLIARTVTDIKKEMADSKKYIQDR